MIYNVNYDDEPAFSNRKPKPFRKSKDEGWDDEPVRQDKKRKKGPDYSLNRKAKRGEE